jgi:ATP-binding cassette subfamily B protein
VTVPRIAWETGRAWEALEALVVAAKLPARPRTAPLTRIQASDRAGLARWLDAAASSIGIEAEPARGTNGEIGALVREAGPALLYFEVPTPCVVALVSVKRSGARLITPEGERVVPPGTLEDALWAPVDAAQGPRADAILERAKVPASRWKRARLALMREPFAAEPVDAGWTLRVPPSAPVRAQGAAIGLPRAAGTMLSLTLLGHVLSLTAWWLVGRGALGGTLDVGWLLAWGLLLLTLIPVHVASVWWQGVLGIGVSALLKRRLLLGALRLDPEEVRGQGTGQVLGRVIEAEAVESLVLNGGFTALLATVELAMAAPVLALSTGGLVSVAALAAWTLLALLIAVRYARRAEEWAGARVRMTDDLVERMVGHRTRLAQEPPETWHEDEDRALSAYVDRSRYLDSMSTLMGGLLARGWGILGLLSLMPGFLVAGRAGADLLAVGIGGVLLARGAFGRLAAGMSSLAGARVAWRQIAPIFRSAARPEIIGLPAAQAQDVGEGEGDEPLLVAQDLVFRYRPQGDAVLRKVTLRVGAHDRVLLEGPSGGGKSSLGSILTGLRIPESGLLLLEGLDRHTLGAAGWRRRVVAAPQFHENHVLSNTLLFNLLMGRAWPPSAEDVKEAVAVVDELGLAPLVERMPAGLAQMVGETGWQLSHGEQSRLFIARALLQKARLVVLDESFAALDPETLARSLRCVLKRAPALIVIAHP